MTHRLTTLLSTGLLMAASHAYAAGPTTNRSVNPLACDLYRVISAKHAGENVFFSPFSIAVALSMAAEGARGQTALEMGHALHAETKPGDSDHPVDLAALHKDFAALSERLGGKPVPQATRQKIAELQAQLAKLNKASQGGDDWERNQKAFNQAKEIAAQLAPLVAQVDQYEFRSANALWGEKSFDFQQSYLDTIHQYYKSNGLFPVDFLGDPEGSRKRINGWVSEQTHDRIKDLLGPGQVTPETRLVLTNAVYFLGEWLEPFEAANTNPEDFFTAIGNRTRIPLMHHWGLESGQYAAFNADGSPFETPEMVAAGETDRSKLYPADGGFLMAELPYKGGDLSMVALLPMNGRDGLQQLEKKLSAENLTEWSSELRQRKMNLFLPRFKLETSEELSDTLKSLGVGRAFVNPAQPNGAQFDGISSSADPAKRLYIGVVVHKAFLDVNEKGTEAAAATGIGMMAGSAMRQEVPFVPTFRADHPFLFLIRERSSGAILFIGRFAKPST